MPCVFIELNLILPECENIIFMAGKKFGTDGNEYLTWAMNTMLPNGVVNRFPTPNFLPLTSYLLLKFYIRRRKPTPDLLPLTSYLLLKKTFLFSQKGFFGAPDRNRTCMKLPSLEPESNASASSATGANIRILYKNRTRLSSDFNKYLKKESVDKSMIGNTFLKKIR